jgi:hypothetical protein
VQIGDALLKLGLDTKDLNSQLGKVEKDFQKSFSHISDLSKKMGVAMTAAGAAIVGALTLAVKTAAEEEVGIVRLSSTLKNVGVSYKDVETRLNSMMAAQQKATAYSASEQRDAMTELVQVTGDYDKALSLLPTALDLAAAKGMDLATAAQYIGRAAEGDIMMLTRMFPQLKNVAKAQEDLTKAQKDAEVAQKAPTSAESDALSIQEQLLGLARQREDADRGLIHAQEGADDAAKGLADAQANLSKVLSDGEATKEDLKRAHEAIAQAQRRVRDSGWALDDAQNQWIDTANEQKKTEEELTDAEKKVKTAHENATRATDGLTAAQDKAAASGDVLKIINDTVKGSAEEMGTTMSAQFKNLQNSMQDLMVIVGEKLFPILQDLLQKYIMPAIEAIMTWIQENPELTKALVIVAAAVGSLMLVLGPLLIALPGIIAAVPILGVVLTALTGPIGWVILGITALVAAGVAVVANWDWIKAKASEIWGNIKSTIGNAVNWCIDRINSLIGLINKIPGVNIPSISTGGSSSSDTGNAPPPTPPGYAVPAPGQSWFWGKGGTITEPTLLTSLRTMRPYAIAGESGPERVVPGLGGEGVLITGNTFNVRNDQDINLIAERMVGLIRLKTVMRV